MVYPKFIHDPSEESGLAPTHDHLLVSGRLPSLGGGWDGSSSGELDSWSWDNEEENEGSPYDGSRRRVPALPSRRRCSEDGLLRPADGDYVELLEPLLEPRLEPRLGPDGGLDTKQRYLEMHGICKTRTLPLCRRGRAIKLRKGKAWGHTRAEGSGSFRAAERSPATSNDDISLPPRRPGGVPTITTSSSSGAASPPRGTQCWSSTGHDSDEGDKTLRSSELSEGIFYDSQLKERRPGVGKERDSGGLMQPDTRKNQELESGKGQVTSCLHSRLNRVSAGGQSDPGSHSNSIFEDKPLSGESDATTLTSDTAERPFRSCLDGGAADGIGADIKNGPRTDVASEQDGGKSEDQFCPRGKEVKSGGFRAPRF